MRRGVARGDRGRHVAFVTQAADFDEQAHAASPVAPASRIVRQAKARSQSASRTRLIHTSPSFSCSGACSGCDGLGVKQFFDPALVVADEDLTLAEGAIRGWDRRNVYYFHMLSSLSEHYGFDVESPFKDLKKTKLLVVGGGGLAFYEYTSVSCGLTFEGSSAGIDEYLTLEGDQLLLDDWGGHVVFDRLESLWCPDDDIGLANSVAQSRDVTTSKSGLLVG